AMKNIINGLPVGTVLRGKANQYRIEQALGQGGFGITYRASVQVGGALGALSFNVAVKEFFIHERNGRRCTTVTLGSEPEIDEDYKRKFVREAVNLSRMRHPNIVRVMETFEANNTVYYSMEYIGGGSLDDRIALRGRLTEAETVGFAREICSALQFMHENGMLHLDLKPLNIMLRDGHAVLIDFGLSKQYKTNGEPESSTKVGGGTPGYAPIEQASYRDGKGFPVTMDIYALGATLYKMLSGQRPPEASDILNDGFPSGELRKAGVSPLLVSLIEKCMSPMRKGRCQTVAEVLGALESHSPKDDIKVEVVYPPASEETEIVEAEPYMPEPAAPKPTSGFINGHEYVDLGLSVKWATCNVGARVPSVFGDYFAWGETKPKSSYTKDNSVTSGKSVGEIAGNPFYDAARANWGGTWRLPTKAELEELISECQWEWTPMGSHNGYKVTGTNGKSIFLPAAGRRDGASLYSTGGYGGYWSSTPYDDDTQYACSLYFSNGNFGRRWISRSLGRSVRPVLD
ncbi:MAG: protein kinase, partial [Prevotellaceae bacterium]|nr:protein kinase [Prevotellaceae bacterium]